MLDRSDPFYSPKYSISRGYYHADEFKARVQEFLNADPYELVTEIEPDTGDHVQKIKLVKPMPQDLEGWAIDAAGNFRNALDQAMFACVGKETYFPFGKTSEDFENAVNGRCKHVPKEIIDIIRGFKPYLSGDALLYSLNKLANANKHGIIVPIASVFGSMKADRMTVKGGSGSIGQVNPWDFTKNEMELNRFSAQAQYFQSNLSATVFVGFHGIESIKDYEATQALDLIGVTVETVVISIEAEAKTLRLG